MIYDVVVIGGGPAGMAAAVSAKKQGVSVLIAERDERLGGILNQCIHNGFGLHYFKEELTGPEYANRFVKLVEGLGIDVMTRAFVLDIDKDNNLLIVSAEKGIVKVKAKAIVLAMGCRERTAGAIAIAGDRPSGVWTAGMAQRLCNIEGKLVGKRVVILGSGDIGLIMARRMTFEGARVEMVCELMPYSGGLKRNISQCLNDYNIPLYFSTTITRIVGKKRLEGVYIAQVDDKGNVKKETERFVECDTLLLSVGLIPENDLIADSDIELSKVTSGAVVDEYRRTTRKGVFACGNALHVHDLVDNVTEESILAGNSAAEYVKGLLPNDGTFTATVAGRGIRYVLPQRITGKSGNVKLFMRTDNVYKRATLKVESGGKLLFTKKAMILTPGEMESVTVDKAALCGDVKVYLED